MSIIKLLVKLSDGFYHKNLAGVSHARNSETLDNGKAVGQYMVMALVTKYWKKVFKRAFEDTKDLFPFTKDWKRASANMGIATLSAFFVYILAGAAPVVDQINTYVAVFLAFVVVFSAAYLMQLIAAPAKLEKDNLTKYKRKTSKDRKLLEKLLEGTEQKILFTIEKRETPCRKSLTNPIGDIDSYNVVRIIVRNKNQIESLKNFRIKIDRINKKTTNIPLQEDTDEDFCSDLAPGEERFYVVALADFVEKDKQSKIDFIFGKYGGWWVKNNNYETISAKRGKIRITATSLGSPKESCWFEIYLNNKQEPTLKLSNFQIEEAKSYV